MRDIIYRPSPGYVYLLQSIGHNVYKIGRTTDLERRLKTYNKKPRFRKKAIVFQYIAAVYCEDYQQAESQLQTKFQAYHLSGEWYALPDSAVEEFKRLAE
jgi:predicted GIY-YIG superfamily endonuclease